MHPYVGQILLFLFYSYLKSHFDNDSCLPIYKTIPAICNTPRQTHCVRNSIFPSLRHGDYVLWAELWFLVVCHAKSSNVEIVQQNYFDKLDTRSKKGGTFWFLMLIGLSTGRYEFMVFVWIQGSFDGVDLSKYCDNILICWLCHVDHGVRERHNRAVLMNVMVRSSVPIRTPAIGLVMVVAVVSKNSFGAGGHLYSRNS